MMASLFTEAKSSYLLLIIMLDIMLVKLGTCELIWAIIFNC